MLLYAWDMAQWRGRFNRGAEHAQTLLGLLAMVLEDSTRRLMRRQLARAHTLRSDTVIGVRGRIDFARSLKRRTFDAGRAVCMFSELGVDTPRNRILRATLYALARDPRVEHSDQRVGDRLRSRLSALSQEMAGVPIVRISAADFSRLQLGRNDRDYALPLAICELIRRLEIPTEARGDHALTALCRDEMKFERLFEAFVRNFYRYQLPDHEVSSQALDWYDELECALVPAMRTDITIVSAVPPHRRLIVDTKFSTTTLAATPHGGDRFKSPNLYQLYTYLRTQEHLSEPHRCAEGMALYPTTSRDLHETMLVQGHRMRVATVNLAEPWEAIEARLLMLARA